MNEEMIFEQEMDTPDGWESNTILVRDGKGRIIEVKADDDIEGGE